MSDDGSEITLQMDTPSSAMYIKRVDVHQQHGGKLYLKCYSSLKSSENSFTINLDKDTESIALCRGENAYEVVLEKDKDGNWQRAE